MLTRALSGLLSLVVGFCPGACLCLGEEAGLVGPERSASSGVHAPLHSHGHGEGEEHPGAPHSQDECSCSGPGIDMLSDSGCLKLRLSEWAEIEVEPSACEFFYHGRVPSCSPRVTDTGPPREKDIPLYLILCKLSL
jgi:hypothetical protein